MLKLGFPVIGVADLPRAVAFRTAAPNLVPTEEWHSGTWRTLNHADGSGRAPRPDAQRLCARAAASPPLGSVHGLAEEQQAEVRRLTCLGARVDGWDLDPADPDFVVMADPGSNVFRVVDLSHAPSGGPSRSRTDGLPERGLRREE